MVSERQRRRALARAKWQRQQARRSEAERRARYVRIGGGAAVTLVVLSVIGWGAYALITSGSDSPSQTNPPSLTLPPNTLTMHTPTGGGLTVTSFSPGPPTTPTTGAGGGTGPTGPVTTGGTP